jgi:hypothetical protein
MGRKGGGVVKEGKTSNQPLINDSSPTNWDISSMTHMFLEAIKRAHNMNTFFTHLNKCR